MDDLSDLLPGGSATVKQHSVNSDGQTITTRSAADMRDLISLEIEQDLTCAGRQRVMANVFGTSTRRVKYGCTR